VWLGQRVYFSPLDPTRWQGLAAIDLAARLGRYSFDRLSTKRSRAEAEKAAAQSLLLNVVVDAPGP
jgi:hypothetical protein